MSHCTMRSRPLQLSGDSDNGGVTVTAMEDLDQRMWCAVHLEVGHATFCVGDIAAVSLRRLRCSTPRGPHVGIIGAGGGGGAHAKPTGRSDLRIRRRVSTRRWRQPVHRTVGDRLLLCVRTLDSCRWARAEQSRGDVPGESRHPHGRVAAERFIAPLPVSPIRKRMIIGEDVYQKCSRTLLWSTTPVLRAFAERPVSRRDRVEQDTARIKPWW